MRTALLRVETDLVKIMWSGEPPPAIVPNTWVASQVVATARRPGLEAITLTVDGHETRGIAEFRLFEQLDYQLIVIAKRLDARVRLTHRDPVLLGGEPELEGECTISCTINFGSQVGRTQFSVLVDGEPELDLELEVCPTKLDYVADFERLLADVQQMSTGLALEYLRSTYRLSVSFQHDQPSDLEWIVLLRHVAVDLDQALRFIAAHPVRGLVREARTVPVSRVHRIDSVVRAEIQRGRGRGPYVRVPRHPPVRGQITERRAEPTLDTVEHRWLAAQVHRFQRRVGELLAGARIEAADPNKARARQIVRELEQLEAQLAELATLGPIVAARGLPPAGYASLQLLGAPGYRDAYQHCLILGLGLRIEGGPFEVSLKDLGTLYEYWCYLSVLQIIAEETQSKIPIRDLVMVQDGGLRVLLEKGNGSRVTFGKGSAREIDVLFNPTFLSPVPVADQKPDIVISFRIQDWPTMELLIDAKYRVEAGERYLQRTNNVPGPPLDAFNTLHRYRDSILSRRPDNEFVDEARPADNHMFVARPNGHAGAERSVLQAVVFFPGTTPPEAFRSSVLWGAITDAGIGALPALPDQLTLVRQWLRSALTAGGWALSDLASRHVAAEQAREWQRAERQPVLIAILRGRGDRVSDDHLAWIGEQQRYYLPAAETQPRQRLVHKIAFYMPAGGRSEQGEISYVAEVERFEILPRRAIETPWRAVRDLDEPQVLYHLRWVAPLKRSIANTPQRGPRARMSRHRWTSALGLLRAKNLHELMLETEAEWRLLERLDADGLKVRFEAESIRALDPDRPQGRAWFVVEGRRARFAGASGFLLAVEGDDDHDQPFATLDAAFRFLTDAKLAGP